MIVYIIFSILTVGFTYSNLSPSRRFRIVSSSGWSSYYHAAAVGFLISFYGLAFSVVIYSIYPIHIEKLSSLAKYLPFDEHIVSESIFLIEWTLFSLCYALFKGCYLKLSRKTNIKALESLVEFDPFKKKIFNAVRGNEILQISLKNRKVYVGMVLDFCLEDADPNKKYLSFCPIKSGYRDEHDLSLHLLNDYSNFYISSLANELSAVKNYIVIQNNRGFFRRFKEKLSFSKNKPSPVSPLSLILKRFSIVVPIDEIIHIGSFDEKAYLVINGVEN